MWNMSELLLVTFSVFSSCRILEATPIVRIRNPHLSLRAQSSMELNQRNKKIEEETFEFGRAQITTTTSVFDEPKSELQKLKSSRKLDKKPRMPVVDPPVKIRTELYKSKKDQISKANRKLEDLNKVCGDRRRPDDYCRGRDCGDSEHEKR